MYYTEKDNSFTELGVGLKGISNMGSIASRGRSTTIHVTQIQETHLEVKGQRLSPKTKPPSKTSSKSTRPVRSGQTNAALPEASTNGGSDVILENKGTEMTTSEKNLLIAARQQKGRTLLINKSLSVIGTAF